MWQIVRKGLGRWEESRYKGREEGGATEDGSPVRPLGEGEGSVSAHRSTEQLSCCSATEHNFALSITHMLKCMAKTRCICAALLASTGRGPFLRDKPDKAAPSK